MNGPVLRPWPPLPPGAWLRPPQAPLPFPLEHPGCSRLELGRHALWHGVRALGLVAGDEVLAPAYHHGSEIVALARAGVRCRFFAGGPGLEPREDELEALLGPRVRALLLIHYLGFPQDASRWRDWCDRNRLLLIEDAAQAWLATRDGRPVGALGEIAIFCLYKTIGVPDGALLLAPGESAAGARRGRWQAAALARRHAAWVGERNAAAGRALRALQRTSAYDPEADFALGRPLSAPSRATALLVPRLAHVAIAAERRARYGFLLDELGEHVPAPFDRLAAGASPFAFPIESDDKAEVLDRLARGGILALDFWSRAHPSLPLDAFPHVAARRARTLGLPVHQELTATALERIVAAVRRGRRRPRPELRLEPIEDLAGARAEWTALAEEVGDPFATWEWADSWCRHMLHGRELQLIACRRASGELAAVLPLYESARRPLRVLRFLGSGPADRQGPICVPAVRAPVARALRRALAGSLRCDVLLAERLPGDAGWSALFDGARLMREASPLLRLDGRSWEQLLSMRSRHFRAYVRRSERRLAGRFALRYRLADDPVRLAGDLDTLVALHAARWRGESDAFEEPRRSFHAELAARALRGGWLRLWFLELDERPVAAWYGFRYGGADWFYQAGRDPGWDEFSVGFVLVAHTVREAARDGMRAYHLLRGDDPYKARFADTDSYVETIAIGCSARGRAAVAGAAATVLLPPSARRIVAHIAG